MAGGAIGQITKLTRTTRDSAGGLEHVRPTPYTETTSSPTETGCNQPARWNTHHRGCLHPPMALPMPSRTRLRPTTY